MSDPFDPYHHWLGISPKKQPPNHYSLLGLDAFESNPDVIENAADQRMAHLRTFQSGKRGELSQQLLNEVSAARICLLDQAKKAAYDKQLRGEVEAAGGKRRCVSDVPTPTRTRTSNLSGLTPSSMLFDHRQFRLPKDEERPEEYEDACAVNPLASVAAVAGGVSSSLFSGTWARLLVDAAVKDPPNIYDGDWLAQLRKAWSDPVDVDSLTSHQQPRVQEGASSTLLIVQLSLTPRDDAEAAGPIRLSACAAGDCCLFHVRGDQVLRIFPYEESRLFQQDPQVIRSVDCQPHREIRFDTLEDDCRPDDLIVLCTDAIAAWALVQLESGHSPNWQNCWDLSQLEWSDHVHRLREQRVIRCADTTVLLLKVAQHKQTALSEERKLHADWQDDVRQTFDEFTRQGRKALQDLKEQGKKAIDWFKSSGGGKK